MIIREPLYREIVRSMPIPCVDLRVTDPEGKVLLVKRVNAPARGEWWFPGGRVHFGETRLEAAARKLREECGLEALSVEELGTFDLFLHLDDPDEASHGITTLYDVQVGFHGRLLLDEQSEAGEWRTLEDWNGESLHSFMRAGLDLGCPTNKESHAGSD